MADAVVSTKTCACCHAELPLTSFYQRLNRHGNPSVDNHCKTCRSAKTQAALARRKADPAELAKIRAWRLEHKRKVRTAKGCTPRTELAAKGEARRLARYAISMAVLQGKLQEDAHVKRWRYVLQERQKHRLRRATPKGTLDDRIKVAIWKALRGNKAGRSWESLVGYTLTDLYRHIERQFTKGMGWHNMGEWHIDHIRPRASFDYQTPECDAFRQCWSLTNLRPLWARDNIIKGDRVTMML